MRALPRTSMLPKVRGPSAAEARHAAGVIGIINMGQKAQRGLGVGRLGHAPQVGRGSTDRGNGGTVEHGGQVQLASAPA